MKTTTVTGALLYFENGTRKRIEFTARVKDTEAFRETIKAKHGAKVARLTYESEE